MKCSICKGEIEKNPLNGWDQGNNAEPVVYDGRCCGDCDNEVVIPCRLFISSMVLKRRKRKKLLDTVLN
jgi:hypothetical protein